MYNHNQLIHFIGIGGVGMAGIAEVLLNIGYRVSGSDIKPSTLSDYLSSIGATIEIGHDASNIKDNISVVVKSSAISDDNVEVIEAKNKLIPIIPRAEMLAELMRMKYGIAIAGSHGKTSTTSIAAKLLKDLGFDPTVIVGGRVLSDQTGARLGSGQYLVAEADESDGSFCMLHPAISVVTNIDTEHMSYYQSLGAIEEAFLQFMNSVPFYGLVIYCGDDPILQKLSDRFTRRSISYGLSSHNEIYASDIEFDGWNSSYILNVRGEKFDRVLLPVPGLHMISNSLAAISVALELGAYPYEVVKSLSEFPGVKRRTEKIDLIPLKNSEQVLIIDDYGHHPTEIKATLRAVRSGILPKHSESGRVIVVFEPHRYSRTKELFSEFVTSFSDADLVIVTNIYSAGESPIEGISADVLSKSLQHKNSFFFPDFGKITDFLLVETKPGDIILTLGAGSIGRYPNELAISLRKHLISSHEEDFINISNA